MLKSNALGIMNQMWAAHATSDAEAIATAIEETLLAEELGFDSVWIGEHHNVRPGARFYGRIPASEMFLAHLAAKTTRIALGTGVRILSTTPPQRTAEEMSLLDLLSGGRAEFGVGLGSTPDVKPGDPARAVKAALFRSLLSDIVSYLSGTAEGPPISPAPAPDLAARIWAAARDQSTLAHIADAGINLVVGQAELPPIQAAIVQAYRAAGGTGLVRGVRLVFVAETHAEAMRDADEALSLYLGQMGGKGYHSEAIAKGLLAADPRTLEERGLGVNFLIGSPEEVAALLNDYVAETGVDRLDLMVQVPGLRTDAVRRSMALIQQAVKPLLKRALPQPAIA
jgi:alkanesulfonate monooxygenase SsuD/methylene tetrahydromethanopterin reductase-like flavin-dependent oxidoreductase (luciferase family)